MKPLTIAASAAILASSAAALYMAMPAYAAAGWGRSETMTWAAAKAKSDQMWTRLDANKDGVLSQVDRDAKLGQKFDEIDGNHNGEVSREEWTTHHRAMMDRKGGSMSGMGPDGPMGGPMPMAGMEHDSPHSGMGQGRMGHHGRGHRGMNGGMMGHAMLMAADTNTDGKITRAEFDLAVKSRFDKADANHDGKLMPAERQAAMAEMRRSAPPKGDLPPPPPNGM